MASSPAMFSDVTASSERPPPAPIADGHHHGASPQATPWSLASSVQPPSGAPSTAHAPSLADATPRPCFPTASEARRRRAVGTPQRVLFGSPDAGRFDDLLDKVAMHSAARPTTQPGGGTSVVFEASGLRDGESPATLRGSSVLMATPVVAPGPQAEPEVCPPQHSLVTVPEPAVPAKGASRRRVALYMALAALASLLLTVATLLALEYVGILRFK